MTSESSVPPRRRPRRESSLPPLSVECPSCGSAAVTAVAKQSQVAASDGTVLEYTAPFLECGDCGERFQMPEQAQAAHLARVAALRAHEGLLTPMEIRALRVQLGLTQEELERRIRAGKKSVVRWESGRVRQSRANDALLRQLVALRSARDSVFIAIGERAVGRASVSSTAADPAVADRRRMPRLANPPHYLHFVRRDLPAQQAASERPVSVDAPPDLVIS